MMRNRGNLSFIKNEIYAAGEEKYVAILYSIVFERKKESWIKKINERSFRYQSYY